MNFLFTTRFFTVFSCWPFVHNATLVHRPFTKFHFSELLSAAYQHLTPLTNDAYLEFHQRVGVL